MTTKHFEAVIAKNDIARWLRDTNPKEVTYSDLALIRLNIEVIETYIGQANQPSVKDIIESDYEL